MVLRTVGVGELLLSKDNCVFWVGVRSETIVEEEGLDAVLEEVLEAKCAVVDAVAESGSGFFSLPS